MPEVIESNHDTKKRTDKPCWLFLTVNMQYPIADACVNMNTLQCTHCSSCGHCTTRWVNPMVPQRTGGNKHRRRNEQRCTQTSNIISTYRLFNNTFQLPRLFGDQCDKNHYQFKGKVVLVHGMKACEGAEVQLHHSHLYLSTVWVVLKY